MRFTNMGVFINGGSLKWLVYRENPTKMNDLGVPLFQETSIYVLTSMMCHLRCPKQKKKQFLSLPLEDVHGSA